MSVDKAMNNEPEIPKILAQIVRKGDRVKITIDKYSLELIPLPDTKQSYDFVTLEQFITKTATLIYQDIVKASTMIVEQENTAKEFRQKFLSAGEESTEQKLINLELKKRELDK